jgi:hypothetical protein
MATINLGRIKPVWQGLWAASTAYVKDDIVRYDVDSYICTASHTSSANFASDSANWDLVAQGSTIPSQSGQSGSFLTTDGTDLSWGESDWVKLTSVSSGVAASAVTFPTIFSDNPDYSSYRIIIKQFRFSSRSRLAIQLYSSGSTIETGSVYYYAGAGYYRGTSNGAGGTSGSADTHWEFSDWNGSNSYAGVCHLTISNPNTSARPTSFSGQEMGIYNGFEYYWSYTAGGLMRNTNAHTGFRMYPREGGNVVDYDIDVYGIR